MKTTIVNIFRFLKKLIFCCSLMCGFSVSFGMDNNAYVAAKYNVSVEDDLAARQVIARLNHALDAADYNLYGSFFAKDGVFESDFGDAVGPQQVAQALEAVRPFITNKRHVAANHVINKKGDQLVVTTYLVVFERSQALLFVGSAVNFDTLEKRSGEWKVVRHASTLDEATSAAMKKAMGAQQ